MKLRHIYINKEGEPMANPYMEYPKPLDFYDFEVDDGDFQKVDDDYNEALEKYHSGLLPFEDAMKIFPLHVRLTDIKPDTPIPVDIEVEVVEQWRSEATKNGILAIKGDGGLWHSMMEDDNDPNKEYRKVLRIKN